jgi:hypothetical protein
VAKEFALSIETSFMCHVKTRKFCRLMGEPLAFGRLIALWSWAVDAASNGDLTTIDVPEIEDAAKYHVGDGRVYRALVESGFIDEGPDGSRHLHNWMRPGRTGYAIKQLEAERDRWRRSKGIPTDSTRNPAGVPRETSVVPAPSRFTVHGSEEISPPACDPTALEQAAAAPAAIQEAVASALSEDEPAAVYGPPISAPPERRRIHFAAKTPAFKAVYDRYPRKDAEARAAQEFQEIAAGYPGGESALSRAILAAFDAGMLKRHPYNGPNEKRPYLETVLAERRWEDAASEPDEPPAPKASGPPRAPGPIYARLSRESSR